MHQTVYWCLDDIVLVLPAFGTTLGSSVGFDNTIRCVGHLVQTRFGGMIFMHRTEQIRAQTYMYVYKLYTYIYVYISMIGRLTQLPEEDSERKAEWKTAWYMRICHPCYTLGFVYKCTAFVMVHLHFFLEAKERSTARLRAGLPTRHCARHAIRFWRLVKHWSIADSADSVKRRTTCL